MSTSPWVTSQDLKTSVSHAMKLLSAGESRLARQKAEEILRQYPREINALFVVASAIRSEGENLEAAARLKALIKRAPDFALAQQELGFAYSASGKLFPAIAALQHAVKIQPKLSASGNLRGELFLIDGY